MRIVSSIALLLFFLLSGCAVFEKELTNRGGYLDDVVDRHWMKADSKGMRALRAFAIQVSLARVASVSAKNDSDRQLLAFRVGKLTPRFLPIYACAYDTNPLAVAGAEGDPCFYYDSAMVEYSTGLFDLAMVALPLEDAKKLIDSVTGSAVNPINIADVLNSLLTIGKDAIRYGRVVGALYRDTIELEVQLWLATPAIDNRPDPYRVSLADVQALREIYDRRNDDLPAWLAEIQALRARGLEPLPHPKFFGELSSLMKYVCTLITKESDALAQCVTGLPLPPPAVVFRALVSSGNVINIPKGGRIVGPAATIPRGPREALPGVANNPPADPREPKMDGGSNEIERAILRSIGQSIQANLCVTPISSRFDPATREAIKQAKLGGNQSGPDAQPFNNVQDKITSRGETDIFLQSKPCGIDKSGVDRGYRTAFEKFAFANEPAVKSLQAQLAFCDTSLKDKTTGRFDELTRAAIKVAKGKLNAERRAGLGDLDTDTLNDKSYNAISRTCR